MNLFINLAWKFDDTGSIQFPWKKIDDPFPWHCTSSYNFSPEQQVIVVPHSHNDPGWLKTFEQYFEWKTKNIINNIVTKLNQYPNMTFIWTEISFLNAWWERSHPVKQKVHCLCKHTYSCYWPIILEVMYILCCYFSLVTNLYNQDFFSNWGRQKYNWT